MARRPKSIRVPNVPCRRGRCLVSPGLMSRPRALPPTFGLPPGLAALGAVDLAQAFHRRLPRLSYHRACRLGLTGASAPGGTHAFARVSRRNVLVDRAPDTQAACKSRLVRRVDTAHERHEHPRESRERSPLQPSSLHRHLPIDPRAAHSQWPRRVRRALTCINLQPCPLARRAGRAADRGCMRWDVCRRPVGNLLAGPF